MVAVKKKRSAVRLGGLQIFATACTTLAVALLVASGVYVWKKSAASPDQIISDKTAAAPVRADIPNTISPAVGVAAVGSNSLSAGSPSSPARPVTPIATQKIGSVNGSGQAQDANQLMGAFEKLNDKCRGGAGDSPATQSACDKRDSVYADLKSLGWCYEPRPGTWQRCDGGAVEAQAGQQPTDKAPKELKGWWTPYPRDCSVGSGVGYFDGVQITTGGGRALFKDATVYVRSSNGGFNVIETKTAHVDVLYALVNGELEARETGTYGGQMIDLAGNYSRLQRCSWNIAGVANSNDPQNDDDGSQNDEIVRAQTIEIWMAMGAVSEAAMLCYGSNKIGSLVLHMEQSATDRQKKQMLVNLRVQGLTEGIANVLGTKMLFGRTLNCRDNQFLEELHGAEDNAVQFLNKSMAYFLR